MRGRFARKRAHEGVLAIGVLIGASLFVAGCAHNAPQEAFYTLDAAIGAAPGTALDAGAAASTLTT